MATRKNFVLRVDEATYNALEKWAADEFRSVNGQIEWLIREALKKQGRLPKADTPPADEEDSGGKGVG
jgi:hypothetical protein